MDVIPGINVKTNDEFLKQINQISSLAESLHIDVMDGRFVKQKTVQSSEVNSLKKTSRLQIHYMGYQPLKEFRKYENIDEFVFHVEVEEDIIKVIKEIKSRNVKVGIAFTLDASINRYNEAVKQADIALVMAIKLGPSGQRMHKEQLKKIAQIRKINKDIKVGVDGGINKLTIKRVRADFAVATSAVFNAEDPRKALRELKAQVLKKQ